MRRREPHLVNVVGKRSASPRPSKGFWQALQDLEIERAFVAAPLQRRCPLAAGVDVVLAWDIGRSMRPEQGR